jgi:hypothetical protein
MSRRSSGVSPRGGGSRCTRGKGASLRACSAFTRSSRCAASRTTRPCTSAASSAQPRGRTSSRSSLAARSASAIASAPLTGRSSPDRPSSPAHSMFASMSASICPLAASRPSAIGRSKRAPSFGRSAGDRLTVMRLFAGNSSPLLCNAARTRSRDSLTSRSARPTRVKDAT